MGRMLRGLQLAQPRQRVDSHASRKANEALRKCALRWLCSAGSPVRSPQAHERCRMIRQFVVTERKRGRGEIIQAEGQSRKNEANDSRSPPLRCVFAAATARAWTNWNLKMSDTSATAAPCDCRICLHETEAGDSNGTANLLVACGCACKGTAGGPVHVTL